MRHATAIFCTASILLAFGCEEQSPSAATPASSAAASNAPAWILAGAPAAAMSVTEAKASSAEGDTVVVRGIIGGNKHPISADSPVIRIIDAGLHNECTADDDHCRTPWDYCCAAPDDIAANAATVQLLDADGSPFAGDPSAILDPLDEVIIVGRVGPRPSEDVLTILTTGVYRVEN